MQLSYVPGPSKGCDWPVCGPRVGSVACVSEPLWRSRREAFFYLLPVGVLLLIYAVMIPFVDGPDTMAALADLAVGIGLVLLLVLRKRMPLVIGVLVTAVVLGMLVCMELVPQWLQFKQNDPWLPLAAPVATYTVALYRNTTTGWALIAALTALVCRPWDPSADVITGGILFVAVPALLGLYVGAHRRLVTALTDRAERAEREQHLLAEQARAETRVQLA